MAGSATATHGERRAIQSPAARKTAAASRNPIHAVAAVVFEVDQEGAESAEQHERRGEQRAQDEDGCPQARPGGMDGLYDDSGTPGKRPEDMHASCARERAD